MVLHGELLSNKLGGQSDCVCLSNEKDAGLTISRHMDLTARGRGGGGGGGDAFRYTMENTDV